MKIEKCIHYFWFGGNPKSDLIKKCIQSWHEKLPDYTIKEWNESNFDINMSEYTKQAHAHKKYAFVSDYARFHVLSEYGGIYLDVDVEVKKSLDPLLENECFMGFESKKFVAPGLIVGAVKHHPAIEALYETYKNRKFYYSDNVLNETTVVQVATNYLVKNGLKRNNKKQKIAGVTVYPKTYFSPISYDNNRNDFSENTYTVHHYASSWLSAQFKKRKRTTFSEFITHSKVWLKFKLISLLSEDIFYSLKAKIKG